MSDGWIIIHRKMIDWEWYKSSDTKAVFIHLLLTANHKETKYMGHTIQRGACVFGYLACSKATGLTMQNVRTAIKHLKSTGEITSKITNKFSIIYICKYEQYQENENKQANKQANKQLTSNQQTTNNTQQCNNGTMEQKEHELESNPTIVVLPKKQTKVFIKPTPTEVTEYFKSIDYPMDGEAWCDAYEQKGWMCGKSPMKDWKAAVRNWKRSGYHVGTIKPRPINPNKKPELVI